jgi:hypothetical protein
MHETTGSAIPSGQVVSEMTFPPEQTGAGSLATVLPFRGGFLLAPADRDRLLALPTGERTFGHWDARAVGGYRLHFDPMFPCHHAALGDAGIVCLGFVCDILTFNTPEQTAERLVRAWSLSRDALLIRLADCAGTYIVFAYRGTEVEVFLDATGTIGACYTEAASGFVVASHPNLLAELFAYRRSALAASWLHHPAVNQGGAYFPGLRTAFDEVRLLTPNTSLTLPSGPVSRFYPRRELHQRPIEEIVTAIVPLLRQQVQWMSDHSSLAVSLSGGLDTRVTLSAARSVAAQCLFFTYFGWNNQLLRTDLEIATSLAKTFGLRHLPIDIGSVLRPQSFVEAWRRTFRNSRLGPEFVSACCTHFGGRYIHIRSNVLEIARGFYSRNPVNRKEDFDAYKLSRLFRNATAVEFTAYFEEFIETTGFTREAFFGYHYTDLFYWEHRMGAWLSGSLLGARFDHLTFILYNCRSILELLLARPLEDRNSAAVMFALIRDMWPELLSLPIFSGAKYLADLPSQPTG